MTQTPLVAYHGDPDLKARTLEKVAAHRAADQIVQGLYWDPTGHRGCAVGCLLEDPKGGHERYESEFGIPVQLAWLEEGIFEALPVEAARVWPERFLGAVVPGADLSSVWPRFAVWLMTDPTFGIVETTDKDDVKAVCLRVADAYGRIAGGETISDEDAESITDAAWDARAAWAASAARAARAARARAARAARAAIVQASADKLVELIANA